MELLTKIGLSELEARCYIALHEQSGLSGYEVAKRVSVSRTNVYAALRSLMDKGACRLIDGDPVRYDAVPIEQLLRHLRTEFDQTANLLVQQLKTPPKEAPAFYNWQGQEAIVTAAQRLIANASRSIVVDLWAEELPLFQPALLEAELRGVTVVVIVLGDIRSPLNNVIFHKRDEAWPAHIERKFSILCDGSSAVLGSFGGERRLSAVETDHAAVVEVLKNAFYHDLLMTHIETDFGPQLSERYGSHYEKLIDYYKREKGWEWIG